MRIFLVSAFLPEITQQIHSFRASGVISSHTACAFGTEASAFFKSAGSVCTIPVAVALLIFLVYQISNSARSVESVRKRYSATPVFSARIRKSTSKSVMEKHRIFTTSFASVYPHYVAKAEKKGRTKAEVDEIIRWLTGYSQKQLQSQLKKQTDFETFFADAPKPNPSRSLITGVICGVRVEEIKEPTMREIRYLDKLIDELAKGKPMEKILRK